MKLETKFEIDDIVHFRGEDYRVWQITITLDDNDPKPFFEYLLIEPMDSEHNYSAIPDHEAIEEATLVRTAAEEFERLGIEL